MGEELIEKLYEKAKLCAEEIKPTKLQKIKNFLKEYYGLIPTLGGVAVAGATGLLTYSISTAYGLYNGTDISSLYSYASSVSGKFVIPSFLVGQFLTYRLKKSLTSLFK